MTGRGVLGFIVGATATGKSTVALEVAEEMGAEIVNADATALYRGLDIGAAKPSAADRARIPHHLVDIFDPRETCSVVDYQRLAYAAVDDILSRGRPALMVGGSGLHVRAVRLGYVFPPAPPDASVRAALEAQDPDALHARLREADPKAAARTHRNNVRRVVRALEVYEQTGAPLSSFEEARAPRYETRVVGLHRDRAELFARIDARVDRMVAAGLLEEVRGLLEAGVPRDAPALRAIGYKEVVPLVLGEGDLATALSEVRRNTRKLARQQLNTWFAADDPTITWLEATLDNVADRAVEVLS